MREMWKSIDELPQVHPCGTSAYVKDMILREEE